MPNISLLDLDDLEKTQLKPFIKKALRNRAPDPAFHAIMGHNPELCKSMYIAWGTVFQTGNICLLYTSPSPRDGLLSRMPSSA